MRYKQLITEKINQVENGLNSLNHYLSVGDGITGKQIVETLKDKLEEIQGLINTNEDQQ